jgi:hypothetical protein
LGLRCCKIGRTTDLCKGLTGSAIIIVVSNYTQCCWLLLYVRYSFDSSQTWRGLA